MTRTCPKCSQPIDATATWPVLEELEGRERRRGQVDKPAEQKR